MVVLFFSTALMSRPSALAWVAFPSSALCCTVSTVLPFSCPEGLEVLLSERSLAGPGLSSARTRSGPPQGGGHLARQLRGCGSWLCGRGVTPAAGSGHADWVVGRPDLETEHGLPRDRGALGTVVCVWSPEGPLDSPDLSQAEQRGLPGTGWCRRTTGGQGGAF